MKRGIITNQRGGRSGRNRPCSEDYHYYTGEVEAKLLGPTTHWTWQYSRLKSPKDWTSCPVKLGVIGCPASG